MLERLASFGSSLSSMILGRGAVALLACAALGLAEPAQASQCEFGEVTTFAPVPSPGFPEGVVVDGNRVYVTGPATGGTAGSGPSPIFVYDRKSGALIDTIEVAGEDLSQEHALSNAAVDAEGRLYVLSTQLGLIRFEKQGHEYVQEAYAGPFPNQPTCVFGPVPFPCALTNDIAFDDDGSAYVTDSFQATIFRVPPGGGEPEVWYQSPLIAGGSLGPLPALGPNGIRLDPEREYVYFVVSALASDPSTGAVYRLPLVDAPTDDELELVHTYPGFQIPDGIAFGDSGELYVALAGWNQISVLGADGEEIARFQSPEGADIPLDAPASIAFDNRTNSILVTNHALLSGNADNFAVLSICVRDTGDPLSTPELP